MSRPRLVDVCDAKSGSRSGSSPRRFVRPGSLTASPHLIGSEVCDPIARPASLPSSCSPPVDRKAARSRALPERLASQAAARPPGSSDSGSGPANTTSAGGRTGLAPSCTSPSDCWAAPHPASATSCCVNDLCSYTLPSECTGPNARVIQASNYDRSCVSDSDCVLILEGNACYATGCVSGAINRAAQAQYEADIIGICAPLAINCPPVFACCRDSICQTGGTCAPPGGDQ